MSNLTKLFICTSNDDSVVFETLKLILYFIFKINISSRPGKLIVVLYIVKVNRTNAEFLENPDLSSGEENLCIKW